jgi:hypothetical protein
MGRGLTIVKSPSQLAGKTQDQHPRPRTPVSHAVMDIRLFDKSNLEQVPWSELENDLQQNGLEQSKLEPNRAGKHSFSYERRCLVPFIEAGATAFVQNVETDFRLLKAGKHVFPVTINHTEYASSYVCSPYTHNVSYAREELHNLDSKPLQWLCGRILDGLGLVLKVGRINQSIHVNNWLLSTNLYPDWGGDGIAEITRYFKAHWPRHALVFRSINQCYESAAYEKFRQAGYQFFLTRQVYVFDGKNPDYLKTKNFKWDWKLLQKSDYRWVRHDEILESDIPRILALYNDLYLKKYSYHNPQFTEKYLRLCLEEGLLTLHGLRTPEGRLDGIAGYFTRNGIFHPLIANVFVYGHARTWHYRQYDESRRD